MSQMTQARAYAASSNARPPRLQEADLFHRVNGGLRAGQETGGLRLVRALADNRRLWTQIEIVAADRENQLPRETRAQLISISRAVQRELDEPAPDLGFLIEVNENIAAGLAGNVGAAAGA